MTGKGRRVLEWAAARPPRSAWSWGLHPEKVVAHAIMVASLKLFGLLSALVAGCVYFALRMLLLPRVARAVLRRWDLRDYKRRMHWQSPGPTPPTASTDALAKPSAG